MFNVLNQAATPQDAFVMTVLVVLLIAALAVGLYLLLRAGNGNTFRDQSSGQPYHSPRTMYGGRTPHAFGQPTIFDKKKTRD